MPFEYKIIIGAEYVPTVVPLVAAARYSIDVVMYHWQMRPLLHNDPVSILMQAMQDAQARGVTVRAVVGSEAIRAKLNVYGIKSRMYYGAKLVHAKMLLIDQRIAIVGSHNLTKSAFSRNLEISVAFSLKYPHNELVDYFKNLWGV